MQQRIKSLFVSFSSEKEHSFVLFLKKKKQKDFYSYAVPLLMMPRRRWHGFYKKPGRLGNKKVHDLFELSGAAKRALALVQRRLPQYIRTIEQGPHAVLRAASGRCKGVSPI